MLSTSNWTLCQLGFNHFFVLQNLIHLGLSYFPFLHCLSASFNNGQFVIIALSLFLAVGNQAGVAGVHGHLLTSNFIFKMVCLSIILNAQELQF